MKKLLLSLVVLQISTASMAARLTPELVNRISKQIQSEMDAAYTYLAMANRAEALSFGGISHFFTVHFYEEINHAREMTQFLHDQDAKATLFELHAPKIPDGESIEVLLKLFEASLEHELAQTAKIHSIMKLARESEAYAAEVFLAEFVEEQVEEEALFTSLVDRFKVAGTNGAALLDLDRELGKRPMAEIFTATH